MNASVPVCKGDFGSRPDCIRDSTIASGRVEWAYNRQGEIVERKDPLDSVRTFERGKLGRLIHDRVTTLASGVDGATEVAKYT